MGPTGGRPCPRLRALGLALTDRERTAYGRTVLWFLPLLALALAVARAVAAVAADSDAFPVLAMTILVAWSSPWSAAS